MSSVFQESEFQQQAPRRFTEADFTPAQPRTFSDQDFVETSPAPRPTPAASIAPAPSVAPRPAYPQLGQIRLAEPPAAVPDEGPVLQTARDLRSVPSIRSRRPGEGERAPAAEPEPSIGQQFLDAFKFKPGTGLTGVAAIDAPLNPDNWVQALKQAAGVLIPDESYWKRTPGLIDAVAMGTANPEIGIPAGRALSNLSQKIGPPALRQLREVFGNLTPELEAQLARPTVPEVLRGTQGLADKPARLLGVGQRGQAEARVAAEQATAAKPRAAIPGIPPEAPQTVLSPAESAIVRRPKGFVAGRGKTVLPDESIAPVKQGGQAAKVFTAQTPDDVEGALARAADAQRREMILREAEAAKALPVPRVGGAAPVVPEDPLPPPGQAKPSPGAVQTFLSRFRAADNVLRRAGYTGITDPIDDSVIDSGRFMHTYHTNVHEILKESGIKQFSTEDFAFADALDGKPSDNPVVMRAMERLRKEFFDPIWVLRNKVSQQPDVSSVVGPLEYITNYFPRMKKRELELMQMAGDKITPQMADTMLRDLDAKSFTPKFFRKREDMLHDWERSVFNVLPKYLAAAKREIFDIPAYIRAKEALKEVPLDDFGEFAHWYVGNFIGQPTSRPYADELYRKIARTSSVVVYNRFLGFSPKTAIRNFSQTALNTYPELGEVHTLKGITQAMTNDGQKRFLESGLLFDFPELERISEGPRSLLGKGSDAALYMFKKAEILNRQIAYLGGLSKAQSLGLAGREAERYAFQVVEKTQFFYSQSSPVRALSSLESVVPGGKFFQQYPVKEAEFIATSIHDAIKKGEWGRLARMAGVITSGLLFTDQALVNIFPRVGPVFEAFGTLSRYTNDLQTGRRKIEDFPVTAFKTLMYYTPGIGNLMQALDSNEGVRPVSEVEPIQQGQ